MDARDGVLDKVAAELGWIIDVDAQTDSVWSCATCAESLWGRIPVRVIRKNGAPDWERRLYAVYKTD